MGAVKKVGSFFDTLLQYVPEIKVPLRKIPLTERVANTTIALIFFMILSEIYLPSVDPNKIGQVKMLEYLMGTAKGTLFSLGIYPIIMGGFLVQLIVLFKLVNIDTSNPKELDKVEKAKNLTTIIFILFLALSQAFTLSYPTVSAITFSFIMFTIGGFILMLLVDFIDKYGFYSGISLIILLRASKSFWIYLFNPINNPDYGLFTKLILGMLGKEPYNDLLLHPSFLLVPIIGTFALIFLLIYFHTTKVTVARQTTNLKLKKVLPKREHSLLFLSVVPLILGTFLVEAIRVTFIAIGNILTEFGHSIGQTIVQYSNYWLIPPFGWWNFSVDWTRPIVYYTTLFILTYGITYVYLFFSNMTPSRIHIILQYYEPTRRKGIITPRARKVMRILIPISVSLIIIIAFLGNYLMVASGGTGLVLSVSIAIQMYDTFKKMMKKELYHMTPWEVFVNAMKKLSLS